MQHWTWNFPSHIFYIPFFTFQKCLHLFLMFTCLVNTYFWIKVYEQGDPVEFMRLLLWIYSSPLAFLPHLIHPWSVSSESTVLLSLPPSTPIYWVLPSLPWTKSWTEPSVSYSFPIANSVVSFSCLHCCFLILNMVTVVVFVVFSVTPSPSLYNVHPVCTGWIVFLNPESPCCLLCVGLSAPQGLAGVDSSRMSLQYPHHRSQNHADHPGPGEAQGHRGEGESLPVSHQSSRFTLTRSIHTN